MKKLLTLTLLGIGLQTAAMESLPDGNYSGRGGYRTSNGESGHYRITSQISANTLKDTYTYVENGREETKTVEIKAAFTQNGSFDVLSAGHTVGEGYCLDVQCHYSIVVGPLQVEETLTFWQGHFYRLGSKVDKTGRKSWQEDLTASK